MSTHRSRSKSERFRSSRAFLPLLAVRAAPCCAHAARRARASPSSARPASCRPAHWTRASLGGRKPWLCATSRTWPRPARRPRTSSARTTRTSSARPTTSRSRCARHLPRAANRRAAPPACAHPHPSRCKLPVLTAVRSFSPAGHARQAQASPAREFPSRQASRRRRRLGRHPPPRHLRWRAAARRPRHRP